MNLTETLRKTAAKLTASSSLLRRARIWRNTRSGGAAPPPSAFPGWQSIPVLGLLPRLKAISTDPVGLMVRCHEQYGDIFTIYIPFNTFDLTYLMGQDGYQFVLGLPAEEGRMGKVMLNVPAMGFWFPRSDESEEHMQALVVAARPLMADLLRKRETRHDEIAKRAVAERFPRWGAELDLGKAIVEMVHDAAATVMFGEKLWARLRPVAGPAIRSIADSVDVVRVSLANTPYGRFMPEYRATLELHAAFMSAIEEHQRTGAYPVLDRIAAQKLGDEPLPAADVPWMMLSILWNATVYTGAYAAWAFCDLVAHPDLQGELCPHSLPRPGRRARRGLRGRRSGRLGRAARLAGAVHVWVRLEVAAAEITGAVESYKGRLLAGNVKAFEIGWKLEALGPNKTRLTVESFMDPNLRLVPSAFVNSGARDRIRDVVLALKARAERAG